jgi:hypothetical protein
VNRDTVHPSFHRYSPGFVGFKELNSCLTINAPAFPPKVINMLHFFNGYEHFGFLIVEGNNYRARTMTPPPPRPKKEKMVGEYWLVSDFEM